ncbi:MAG: DNA topoisomerase IV subunit A [Magnetococcales bacterium]|nr:DNA topoisomerase IV subunit A [Magnetococcales bacterium]MBF0150919.1 DNA topoisomerase IV subunit A [Magnetococcales bacterium]MBF0173888.1 DNA topoisomerase IV subunit A [Magnetococcales bacterium]MBF0347468.1 DNA topoisomerase IV subunit A [Magnetococcales bacterium]
MAGEDRIQDAPIRLELESRYLAYALSTIISRSLPDVRDGLKPVHRRILYAMRGLHLEPNLPPKKSARVVGDVIGKYHPHGDQAAYDAMVRMAQGFAARYPLVDGQGNFGNIDGDGAAAMRYTEARLTRIAMALLEDIDQDTVDFNETYDGSMTEPRVLPARFPNLLANGSSGIAVGMSTSIPPHHVGEILDACMALIDDPECTVVSLMKLVPGPDFPTGGILVSDFEERREAYETGRGSLRLRARWHKESLDYGQWNLVVTEIPYQVQKSRLIERIALLITEKKCPFLVDVRDESDEAIRIVLEPRSSRLDPEMVMAYLFKNSELETRIIINFNVITRQMRPEVMDLKSLLQAWLSHRFEVHTRRARYELDQIDQRLHLLAGYLVVHLNIDEVIAIIKEHDDPAPVLMARFGLDAGQAEAILNMRLRSLRKLEEMAIRKEMAEKELRATLLRGLLADPGKMWGDIRADLVKTRKAFADVRRTTLEEATREITLRPEDLVQKEPVTVIVSQKGWVKSIKGHDPALVEKVRFKVEDELLRAFPAYANQQISFVARSGKVYSVFAYRLADGKGFGDPMSVLFDMDSGDRVVWGLAVEPEREYFVATRFGQGFRILGKDLLTNYRAGKQVVSFKEENDYPLHIHPVWGQSVAAISRGRTLLVCNLEEFPLLPKGKGVRIIKLAKDELLVDVITFDAEQGVTLDSGKKDMVLRDLDAWRGSRGSRGSMLPFGFRGGAVFGGTGASLLVAGKGYTGELFD